MAIEKKSLISTLKTTKKANVVSSTPSHEAAKFAPKKPVTKSVKARHKMLKTAAKTIAKKMEF